jgi:hypothetical protein
VAPGISARDKCAARSNIGNSSDSSLCELWTVWWIVEMVYLYRDFMHDVSCNAEPLHRLFKGVFFFFLGERIPATNRFCADARLGSISFLGD